MLFSILVVGVALRLEYLLALRILNQKYSEWSTNKRRIFAVRVVSCTHATVSALGCLFSVLTDLKYIQEPYDYHTNSAKYVFLWSIGYFIYDLIDMYIHGELPFSKEYFVHHSLVLIAFSIILYSGKLFGFAMIALLVEVQTIFLHLRTMIRLLGFGKESIFYCTLININMTCLFLFRHAPVTYLLYYLATHNEVPIALRLFLFSGLLFLTYHNSHLTIAMAKTDGFFGYKGVSVLDEDNCDPLGAVSYNNGKSKAA